MLLGSLFEEAMRIEDLLHVVQSHSVRGSAQADITGVACDSRQVKPGYLFVAVPGTHEQGAKYAEDAIRRGAVAVVSQDPEFARKDITHLYVEDARRALAEIACAFYDHPSSKLEMIGITGTNGKTTVSFMLRDMLRAAGRRPGLIGTVQYEMGERCIPANRTTPEATEVQYMLDQMIRSDCKSAVMEVSSHALDQKRVWGVDFDVGIFTNLTQDHLDYHGSMEKYFSAKAMLFRGLGQMNKSAYAVINLDDPWGQQLANIGGVYEPLTFGVSGGAMVSAEDIELGPQGTVFQLCSPWGTAEVKMNLMGRYNVSNALAALAAGGARGIPLETMIRTLAAFHSAPGRLESIPNPRGVHVYVDYAHTDDALANVCSTLREVTPKKLIVVFGCGGDRDRGKRPRMAAAAAAYADCAIVTSDNPRSEDPAAIIAEVVEGFPAGAHFEVMLDREQAIALAVEMARPGDTVLIAGKGHENYQEFAHTVVPFDDREVTRRYLG